MLPKRMDLESLWNKIRILNKEQFPENKLEPILGGGCTEHPSIMFVFINPTAQNCSSSPSWQGPRIPFLGTKRIWKVFSDAGMFDSRLYEEIKNRKEWDVPFAERVIEELRRRKLYFTNIVKWTGEDGTLPDRKKIALFLPSFLEEIAIIKPKIIVTFGLIPFEALSKKKITLSEYYANFINGKRTSYTVANIEEIPLIPCFFPVGRGDPRRATEMLGIIRKEYLDHTE